jgi:hypothetical protein
VALTCLARGSNLPLLLLLLLPRLLFGLFHCFGCFMLLGLLFGDAYRLSACKVAELESAAELLLHAVGPCWAWGMHHKRDTFFAPLSTNFPPIGITAAARSGPVPSARSQNTHKSSLVCQHAHDMQLPGHTCT